MKRINKKSQQKKAKAVVKKSDFVYDLYDAVSILSQGNKTLADLRRRAIAFNADIDEAVVYRFNVKTNKKTKLPVSKYAFKNKLYGPSRSVDGTGFYYEWSWEKKSPFEQAPTRPLPASYTDPLKEIVIEDAVLIKPTFLQKVKRYILNMFN